MNKVKPLIRFETNLIELSRGITWLEASKEWGFLYKEVKENRDNHCLCGSKLKYQYYYYNKNTGKIICCGSECKKYIQDYIVKKYSDTFIKDLTNINIENILDYDLDAYCETNKKRIFNIFNNKITNIITIESLIEYGEYLNEYWFELIDLDEILDKIHEKIEMLQSEIERQRQSEIERQRQSERLRQEEKEKKVRQLLQKDIIDIRCCEAKFLCDC